MFAWGVVWEGARSEIPSASAHLCIYRANSRDGGRNMTIVGSPEPVVNFYLDLPMSLFILMLKTKQNKTKQKQKQACSTFIRISSINVLGLKGTGWVLLFPWEISGLCL